LLDKVVRYRFGDNAELMGAWESARNVAGSFQTKNEPQSGAGGSETPRRRDGCAGFGGEAMRRGRVVGCRAFCFQLPADLSKQTVYAVLHNQAAEHRIRCLYGEDVQIILLDSYV